MKKVTACMIALNESEFIEQNLLNHLPFEWIDQFIIVEGAVEQYMHAATPDGHSRDNTLEIIKRIQQEHPQGKKIELVTGRWKDKAHQRNAYLDRVKNEYILLIDADEFYKEEEISRAVEVMQTQNLNCVIYPHRHFWHDFWHYGWSVLWCKTQLRLSRFKKGWRYNAHYTISDENGRSIQWDDKHRDKRMFTSNCINLAYKKEDLCGGILDFEVWIYHYGHARDPNYVADKAAFYLKRDKKDKAPMAEIKRKLVDGKQGWFDPKWRQGVNCDPATVLKYAGTHPPGIEAHPRFKEIVIKD